MARQRQLRPVRLAISFRSNTSPYRHSAHAVGTYDSELLERSRGLDVLERGLEVLELEVDLLLGGLGVLDGLDLEGVDGLELAAQVIGGGLEVCEALLDLVDDGLVLEDRAVLGEVDRGGLLGQHLHLAAGVLVALLEGLKRGDRLAAEAEGRRDFGPVELEGGASLLERTREISSRVCGRRALLGSLGDQLAPESSQVEH
jgi:hypothetical protein